jgi:hypothetical protein
LEYNNYNKYNLANFSDSLNILLLYFYTKLKEFDDKNEIMIIKLEEILYYVIKIINEKRLIIDI